MAGGSEQYFDLFSTAVGVGGYTAGSGVLNVGTTTGVTLGTGDTCRLLVFRVVTGVITPIVLLKATAVNSGTQFAVTAEGSDANALATDSVINVNSVGGQNKIRTDQQGLDTYSNLPTAAQSHPSDTFDPSDASSNYDYVLSSGNVWVPKLRQNKNITLPPAANTWSFLAQNSATLADLAGGGLHFNGPPASTNIAGITQAAPSTPYTITVGMSMLGPISATGLFFYNSGDSRAVLFHIGCGANGITPVAPSLSTSKWHIAAGNFVFDAAYLDNGGSEYQFQHFAPMLFLRITDDGTNLVFSYGIDPNNFVQFDTRLRHNWMAAGPTNYGIHTQSNFAIFGTIVNVLHHKQT